MKTFNFFLTLSLFSLNASAETNEHLYQCTTNDEAQIYYITTSTHEESTSLDQFLSRQLKNLGCDEVEADPSKAENASYKIAFNFIGLCNTKSETAFSRWIDQYVHFVVYEITLTYGDDLEKKFSLSKNTVAITKDKFKKYDQIAERKIKKGLKKAVQKISQLEISASEGI